MELIIVVMVIVGFISAMFELTLTQVFKGMAVVGVVVGVVVALYNYGWLNDIVGVLMSIVMIAILVYYIWETLIAPRLKNKKEDI